MQNNKTKTALESLSMDLLRIALGLNRGSDKMASRFITEALKRKCEVQMSELKPYMKKIVEKLKICLKSKDKTKKSEDALMFSTLIRNYCQKYL